MKALRDYLIRISPLRPETIKAVQACFEPRILKKHEYFVREGEYAREIAFLQEGIVRAYFLNTEGKEYSKQFFVAPSILGAYSSLISKQPNLVAQQALTDCKMLTADYQTIESLYERFHDLERLGRRIAEFYFMEKEQKEIEMALLDADKRYLILRERFPTIEDAITQYYIASYLGISPTQLSRIRKKMAEK